MIGRDWERLGWVRRGEEKELGKELGKGRERKGRSADRDVVGT